MINFGYSKSKLTGDENIYDQTLKSLPEKYELSNLPEVIDQGSRPICVSAVICDMVKWRSNTFNFKVNIKSDTIYNNSKSATDKGLSPKISLDDLTKLSHKIGYKFNTYAIVRSELVAKTAIINNGPLMIALQVKSLNDQFWNGSDNLGGHAVSLVGWNKNGFILKNSWGLDYGDRGYSIFPYQDFNKIIESWILIN